MNLNLYIISDPKGYQQLVAAKNEARAMELMTLERYHRCTAKLIGVANLSVTEEQVLMTDGYVTYDKML